MRNQPQTSICLPCLIRFCSRKSGQMTLHCRCYLPSLTKLNAESTESRVLHRQRRWERPRKVSEVRAKLQAKYVTRYDDAINYSEERNRALMATWRPSRTMALSIYSSTSRRTNIDFCPLYRFNMHLGDSCWRLDGAWKLEKDNWLARYRGVLRQAGETK